MSLTFSYQLTEDDYFEYYYYTTWKAPWNKKKRLIYLLKTFLWGAILISSLVYASEKNITSNTIFAFLFFFGIFVLIFSIQIQDSYRRLARKIYNDPKNSGLFLKTELTLNETGIIDKDDQVQKHGKWSSIIRKSVTNKHYFLYSSEITALIIPKRILKTTAEKESFEKLLAQYLPLQADLPSVG